MIIQLPKTQEQYYLIVNYSELYIRARKLGYDNVILFTGERFRERDLDILKAVGKSVYLLFFHPDGDELLNRLYQQFDSKRIKLMTENLYGRRGGWHRETKTLKQAVKLIPKVKDARSYLELHRIIKSTDYHNRCGNCHELLKKGAEYCVYCGTPKGMGAFEPYDNIAPLLYGPPNRMNLHCAYCGKRWESLEGLKYPGYCPFCGSAGVIVDDEYRDWHFRGH